MSLFLAKDFCCCLKLETTKNVQSKEMNRGMNRLYPNNEFSFRKSLYTLKLFN